MAKPALGKSLCADWFFLGQDFAVWTVSMDTIQPVYFCLRAKPVNSKFATKTVPYNKELTNRACSSRTGKYWPSVVAVRTNIPHYYPTALCRVQITPKTSTNITRYLYSRGPVRQVCLVLLLLTNQLAGFPALISFRLAYFCHAFPVNKHPRNSPART